MENDGKPSMEADGAFDRESRRSSRRVPLSMHLFLPTYGSPLPPATIFFELGPFSTVLLVTIDLEGGKSSTGAETHWHTFRTLPFLPLKYHKTGRASLKSAQIASRLLRTRIWRTMNFRHLEQVQSSNCNHVSLQIFFFIKVSLVKYNS